MSTIDDNRGVEAYADRPLAQAEAPAQEMPRFENPIVPDNTIGGRALIAVIAIMTFLASLTTGAVIARPQLLLADEPTGNVDPNLAQRLLRLFVELNKSGTSVVIATHDIALMDQYDARRLVLHEGRLHVYD